jgi:hypothetical protein
MTQHPGPDPSAQAGNGITDGGSVAPSHDDDAPPPEPAVERSRFSEWLASFGLGELQNPLLTRTRPTTPRRPAS